MSISKRASGRWIECDVKSCARAVPVPDLVSAKDARRTLKDEGWVSRPRFDFCPDCAGEPL